MNFQDYFWTFRRGFSGLFSGSLGLSSSLVLIKNHVNIYLLDVLTCINVIIYKLYVKIITVHGVLMFHVALIYACNMKDNALASCISYAWSHRVESSVGSWD